MMRKETFKELEYLKLLARSIVIETIARSFLPRSYKTCVLRGVFSTTGVSFFFTNPGAALAERRESAGRRSVEIIAIAKLCVPSSTSSLRAYLCTEMLVCSKFERGGHF